MVWCFLTLPTGVDGDDELGILVLVVVNRAFFRLLDDEAVPIGRRGVVWHLKPRKILPKRVTQ